MGWQLTRVGASRVLSISTWSLLCVSVYLTGQGTTAQTATTVTATQNAASSEPEAEATTPFAASQPQAEVTAEPESESTPESESESTSEPESESTSEPESESTSEPESESTSEPESESTSEPESESTSEPESESTSEPESESTSEPESESTSEPESESTSEPESELTSEPESESTSEPESESTSEPESESTSEPESEVSSQPESAVSSEPESGVTSEPESAVSSEPESAVSSEPESGATSEPQSEGTSEPESAVSSEPESGATSEPQSEGTSEPESAVSSEPESGATSEPQSEGTSEPEAAASAAESEAMSVPEQGPSSAEIVVPPALLILGVVVALLVLLIRSRRASIHDSLYGVSDTFLESIISRKKDNCVSPTNDDIKVIDLTKDLEDSEQVKRPVAPDLLDEPFFTDFDLAVLCSLRNCYNQPKELVRIAVPAIISLGLCPLTLYMFDPFRKFVWPNSSEKPDINDAIACYLSPAGLVYATSFGFAFQQVLNKHHEILTKMTEEISMLDQIATFTVKINVGIRTKVKILHAVKTECIFMVLQVLDRAVDSYQYKPSEDIKVKIWTVVDMLREVDSSKRNHVDRILTDKIIGHIMKLNSICSDRMGILHTRIHPFKWVFLETLGFFSFLGILLLTAHSYRMELVMCIVTVFSISMLCYVVSDLDSPFSGFFRVDIGVLEEVLRRLDLLYEMARHSGHIEVFYPE